MFSKEYGINVKTIPQDFNTWSKILISAKEDYVCDIKEFLNYLEQEHKIRNITMIMVGNKIIYNLTGGLRSSMGYLGAKTINDLQKRGEFVKISKAGFYESMVHNVDQVIK